MCTSKHRLKLQWTGKDADWWTVRLQQLHTEQVCKSSHDHEHSRYVQCMVLYSNTRNDLQDNHSDTTVVMEFAGYGMQDNHSAPASCSTSPPEGCKVNEDVSCSVSLDGCWGAADSRATAS